MADLQDPEQLALLVVQQYLAERGRIKALKALEAEVGRKYTDEALPRGSFLMEVVYAHLEAEAAKDVDHEALRAAAEEEALLQGGHDDYPCTITGRITGAHGASITAICCIKGREEVFTGTGEGLVQRLAFDGSERWRQKVGGGGVLCIALHPDFISDSDLGLRGLLVASSMDGSVTVLDGATGHIVAAVRPHTKYCVRARWTKDGRGIISAAWDQGLAMHCLTGDALECKARVSFASAVADFELLGDKEETVVIALRGTNYLRLRQLATLQDAGREERVNMNALGDDHVSFSATALALEPGRPARYLLVSTDGPRIIMFRVKGWAQVRNFYGLPVENFQNYCALWQGWATRSGFRPNYVIAAAAAGHVCVFHIGTTKVVAQIKAHAQNVRSLAWDIACNRLLTCSFDKSVCIIESDRAVQLDPE